MPIQRVNLTGHQTLMEKLSKENVSLKKQITELRKDCEEREYRQGLKKRPFWVDSPGLWFSITEAEFQTTGVDDDATKFNYVISQLDENAMEKVQDILANPPKKNGYEKLKEELNHRYSKPEQERMQKLFEDELDNRTPTQFYRHLQALAGGAGADKIIYHLWLRRLPLRCQEILVSRVGESYNKLAELADHILEATQSTEKMISAVSTVNNIQHSVDELSRQLIALESTIKHHGSGTPLRSTSKQGSPAPASPRICWYHKSWGVEAYRCIAPCDWKQPEKKEAI